MSNSVAPEANILYTDGRKVPVVPKNGTDFKLDELQKIVGGYIETINLPGGSLMVVNEEGLLDGLPSNRLASRLAYQPIVGNAVVMAKSMMH